RPSSRQAWAESAAIKDRTGDEGAFLRRLHLQAQPAIDRQYLPCHIVVRFQKEQDRASHIFGLSPSWDDSLFKIGIVFSGANALPALPAFFAPGRENVDENRPFLGEIWGCMNQARFWR